MVSFIAALVLGGKWIIHDTDSINTSFPSSPEPRSIILVELVVKAVPIFTIIIPFFYYIFKYNHY